NEMREFELTDTDFNFIKNIVVQHTGIVLTDVKRNMVYGRLSRRLRTLGLSHFKQYCDIIRGDDETELTHFINAITTNLTSFFREKHHFNYLENIHIPELLEKNASSKRIRIWSAGCSTGEEPYTISMILNESIPNIESWDIKILATDLDYNVLETARSGIYATERIADMPPSQINKWFHHNGKTLPGKVHVSDRLKHLITFKQLNLMKEWPFKGPFDAIFCRNVLIYFSKDTQRVLVERYAEKLSEQGRLFLGHSESLFKVTDRFKLIGNTIYQKSC
ncbi:MAG: protein-glutamate O-methyltransferase, partial [Gammaproteobacteria bacterium]|nr:protein-glutamate O-methyltransferase [Gammaproteobacteria bacterium]